MHLSALNDSVPALRVFGSTQFSYGVIGGGCLSLGPGFLAGSSGVQADGYPTCRLPGYSPQKIALGPGYDGGRSAVVGITDPTSVLIDAAPLLAQAPVDVRGWARTGSADVGAFEYAADPP